MSTPSSGPLPVSPSFEPFTFGGYAAQPGVIEGVGFWPRVVARVIDMIVHYLIALCTGVFFGILLAIAAAAAGQPFPAAKLQGLGFAVFFFSLLGSVAYHTICEGVHGSTLGKLVLSMTVVQEDGFRCQMRPALIRTLGYFVDGLFLGIVGYFAMRESPQSQRFGDKWAHTIVCKRSAAPRENLRGAGRFVLGLFLAAIVDAALLMVGLLMKVSF
jgi:uncharacterized RDD family membrane protein YckC